MTGIVSKRGRCSADAATRSGTHFGSRRARWRASIERGDELEHHIAPEVSVQAERRGAAFDVANFLERRLAGHQGRIHHDYSCPDCHTGRRPRRAACTSNPYVLTRPPPLDHRLMLVSSLGHLGRRDRHFRRSGIVTRRVAVRLSGLPGTGKMLTAHALD